VEADEKIILRWSDFFSKTIVQLGFHDYFIVYKKIGSGSFATVYLG